MRKTEGGGGTKRGGKNALEQTTMRIILALEPRLRGLAVSTLDAVSSAAEGQLQHTGVLDAAQEDFLEEGVAGNEVREVDLDVRRCRAKVGEVEGV